MVSLKRINKYLRADEIDQNAISKDSNMKVPVRIDRGTFKWTKDDYPVLNNITLKVNKNKLFAVVGQVGSGKVH
jgi:ABC-type bacteriocin/lantibiotic exporter with double-glycine peptidase domain